MQAKKRMHWNMTEDDVRALLLRETERAGSQRAWAARHGVSAPYVHDVIRGKRAPGRKMLAILGLRRIATYEYEPQRRRAA